MSPVARRLWLWGTVLTLAWTLGLWGFTQARKALPAPGPWVWLWYQERLHGPVRLSSDQPLPQVLEQLGLPAEAWPRVRLWQQTSWRPGDPLPATSSLVFWVEPIPTPSRFPSSPRPLGWLPAQDWTQASQTPFPGLADGTVVVGETSRELRAAARFLGEALAQNRLAPQGLDQISLEDTVAWPPEQPVHRVRIWEEVVLEQSTIPYDVTYQPLPEEPIDTLKVVHPGTVGIQAREVLVRYQDGQEVARIPLGEWVLQPPQPRVLGYGTRITIQTLETPEGPIQYWRAVRVYATSYSPCRVYGPGGPCDDITASGEKLRKGIIAVRLSWYRYMKGMRVYVPGYGFGIIADVGGGLGDRLWIDLGFSEEDYEPWSRWTTLYFLAPPPPPDRILWILPP